MRSSLLRLALIAFASFALYSDLVIAVPGGRLLPDESIYVSAAGHVLNGRDPYMQIDYLYPPPLALAMAVLNGVLGSTGMLYAIRFAFISSFALMGWAVGESMTRTPAWMRLVMGIALATIVKPTVMAMWAGNWQTVAMAGFFLSLLLLEEHPRLAGIALGLSLGLKPAAIVAVPLLAWRHREAMIVACATAAAVVLPTHPLLPQWFDVLRGGRVAGEVVKETFAHNSSFAATLFRATGVQLGTGVLLVLGTALGAILLAVRVPRNAAVALGVTLSQPAMWPYSWTLLYPVGAAALDAAWPRMARLRDRTAAET